jgi:hypothetical protein
MILSSHGIIASISGVAIDADAQAFFDRVTAAGGTLSATEKTAVNTLVLQMKTDSIWTKMKAIYPMVGASAEACAQNLKSSSFTGSFSSGWTFSTNGVKPNNAFFNTGLNTLTNLTQISTHLSVYIRENSNFGEPCDIGNSSDGGGNANPTFLFTRINNLAYFGVADASYGTSIASSDSTGFWCGATNGSLSQAFYRNGALIKTGTTGVSTFANNNLYIGAMNANGTSIYRSNKQNAFASIGDGLTSTEASNFYTAVQAFQTTLSRQV